MVPLEIFGFLHLSLTDVLDILMVAFLIFYIFRWIRGSAAVNIFLAVLLLFLLRVLAAAFNMKMMSAFLGTFLDLGVLALIIIFQPEIRHFLIRFGNNSIYKKGGSFLDNLLGIKDTSLGNVTVNEITEACRQMSADKTGALIVIPHKSNIDHIIETGDKIDSNVNRRLIMNLFFKNSPLHDGAMIISGNRIVAARCTLPITSKTDIPPSLGMRHKAAIGISEETDADVIVVSEETGDVSYVKGGNLTHINNLNELKLLLGQALEKPSKQEE
ncbi:MAG: diadenylate cyclase CdaA [Bacteroidales bacterium]|jgi:uncharacterized protein (TIGR00159 family)|nr:diadenylate cyclase CdaA [Bacteroidales bacterium]